MTWESRPGRPLDFENGYHYRYSGRHDPTPARPLVLGAASVLALAGCAGASPSAGSTPSANGKVAVVASTDVYGSIAQDIGGDFVNVTSIITSPTQDPHEYEASAQDQLTLKGAQLVIENGAGYDSFMESLVEASGSTAEVLTAVEYNHDYPGAESHDDASAAPARAPTITRTPRARATTTSRASTSTSGTTRTPSKTSRRRSPSTSASSLPNMPPTSPPTPTPSCRRSRDSRIRWVRSRRRMPGRRCSSPSPCPCTSSKPPAS